jgi:hypothetical protein
MRDFTPLAAGTQEIEDGIDDFPDVKRAFSSRSGGLRDVWRDQWPFIIGHVARIALTLGTSGHHGRS